MYTTPPSQPSIRYSPRRSSINTTPSNNNIINNNNNASSLFLSAQQRLQHSQQQVAQLLSDTNDVQHEPIILQSTSELHIQHSNLLKHMRDICNHEYNIQQWKHN